MAGIYIHIPFCKQACYYCDFHFSTSGRFHQEMTDALCKEIKLQQYYLGEEPIHTIYFGGGTPTLLNAMQLEQILTQVLTTFKVRDDAEVTIEANPDDLSKNKLLELKELGFNRLSIGIQSFDEDVLQFLNRAHNARESIACIEESRKAGFENISLDLIYGIPDRSNELWKKDLAQAIAFKPTHLSSYCLTIEPQTVFGKWNEKGKLKEVSDDFSAEQFDMMLLELDNAGYEQYEVSNFCLPGFESRHNSSYWKQELYLGIGPSAHSYNRINRQFNISHNKKYLQTIAQDKIPFTLDRLSKKDRINDYLLTTLRTKWGADLDRLNQDYGFDLLSKYSGYIEQLQAENLAILVNNHLVLTKKGLLLADKISADLFEI